MYPNSVLRAVLGPSSSPLLLIRGRIIVYGIYYFVQATVGSFRGGNTFRDYLLDDRQTTGARILNRQVRQRSVSPVSASEFVIQPELCGGYINRRHTVSNDDHICHAILASPRAVTACAMAGSQNAGGACEQPSIDGESRRESQTDEAVARLPTTHI